MHGSETSSTCFSIFKVIILWQSHNRFYGKKEIFFLVTQVYLLRGVGVGIA